MTRSKKYLTALALALAVPTASARASFQDQGWSARASGMAGAFSAAADDGGALFWNPAGTAAMERAELSFLWFRPYQELEGIDVNSGLFSLTVPGRFGTFGLAATDYNADDLLRENVGLLHYSRQWGKSFAAGVNLKYLTHDYLVADTPAAAGNAAFSDGSRAGAFSADAGVLFRPRTWLAVGASGRNLTRPDVGLKASDKVPAEYQAGLAWHPRAGWTLAADGYLRDQDYGDSDQKSGVLLGAEAWLFPRPAFMLGLRGGWDVSRAKASVGASFYLFPRRAWSPRLDYAFLPDGDIGDTHKMGLSVFFGGERGAPPAAAAAPAPASGPKAAALSPASRRTTTLAIAPFDGRNVPEQEGAAVSDRVRGWFVKSGEFTLINPAAAKGARPVADCRREGCAAEWGRALGVQRVLVGVLNRQDGAYYVKLIGVDAASGQTLFSEYKKAASSAEALAAADALAQKAVSKLKQ